MTKSPQEIVDDIQRVGSMHGARGDAAAIYREVLLPLVKAAREEGRREAEEGKR